MPTPSLLQRLKERKLVQWALAYLAGAWVLFEVSDAVGGRWSLPDALFQGLFVLLVIGYFITLILAWYHGEKGRQRVSGPELLMVAALLVVAGVALSTLGPEEEASSPSDTVASAVEEDDRPSIAVLPFDNFSPNPDDAYFADGMQEEITSKLSKISALRVISRTSVMQYRGEDKPAAPQIAEELGVDFIVEGSARLAGDQVRLTVQLIDARRDEHLWADDYDLDLSAENLFEVEGEIAQRVAFEIGVNLTPEERDRVARVLTENTEAFLLFLQGNEAFLEERVRGNVSDWFRSTEFYEQAVGLDQNFALAQAKFALSLSYLSRSYVPDKYERAKREADIALALMPRLAEAHLALGRYLQWEGQPQEAMRKFQMVLEENPNSALAASLLGESHQMLGEFDTGLSTLKRAEQLSPRDPLLQQRLAWTYIHAHLYDDALQAAARLETLQETNHPIVLRALINFLRGEPEDARLAISNLMASYPEIPHAIIQWVPMAVVRRVLTPDQLRTAFEARMAASANPEAPCLTVSMLCIRKAIQEEEVGSRDQARVYWDSLAMVMEESTSLARKVLIFQGLGQKESAIQTAEAYASLDGAGREGGVINRFYAGPNARVLLARVLAHFGEHDRAIDILEEELPAPSWLSVPLLEVDPVWDPLRDHPRFQALLER